MRFLLLAAICPFISGCLAIGYPSFSRTPAVEVPEGQEEVHAFCFTRGSGFYGAMIAGAMTVCGDLTEAPWHGCTIDPVTNAGCNYYCALWPVVAFSSFQDVELRLYRPGHEMVTKQSVPWWRCWRWCELHEVQWVKSPDFVSQEKALDDLLGGVYSLSDERMRAFVAEEYRRIAALPELAIPEGALYRRRLMDKARKWENSPVTEENQNGL
jgi:hypothetical protein